MRSEVGTYKQRNEKSGNRKIPETSFYSDVWYQIYC